MKRHIIYFYSFINKIPKVTSHSIIISRLYKYISVASRKNQLSDEFCKIGFMPYFLSLNSLLSRYRDRNSKSALAFLKQHMEKR